MKKTIVIIFKKTTINKKFQTTKILINKIKKIIFFLKLNHYSLRKIKKKKK